MGSGNCYFDKNAINDNINIKRLCCQVISYNIMKNMKKMRILAFIILAALLLAGCGQKEEKKTTEPAPAENTGPGLIVP